MKKIVIAMMLVFSLVFMGCGSMLNEASSRLKTIHVEDKNIYEDEMTCYNIQDKINKLHTDRVTNLANYKTTKGVNMLAFFPLLTPIVLPLLDISTDRYLKANDEITKRIDYLGEYGASKDCVLIIPEKPVMKKVEEKVNDH